MKVVNKLRWFSDHAALTHLYPSDDLNDRSEQQKNFFSE